MTSGKMMNRGSFNRFLLSEGRNGMSGKMTIS